MQGSAANCTRERMMISLRRVLKPALMPTVTGGLWALPAGWED
jgi:hypothetical protein